MVLAVIIDSKKDNVELYKIVVLYNICATVNYFKEFFNFERGDIQ